MTIIDLLAVRRGRDALAALASAHPELTTSAARARLAARIEDLMTDDALSKSILLRLSPADLARLDAIEARLAIGSRSHVLRQAMRLGLDALEARGGARKLGAAPKRGPKTPARGTDRSR